MPAKKPSRTEQQLRKKIRELEIRLSESEDALRAIREGEVDALVVAGKDGEQVYSLVGADSIYRLIVETMKEAAFTLAFDGTILFSNAQFGTLVGTPLEDVVGKRLVQFVANGSQAAAVTLLEATPQQHVKTRIVFQAADGTCVPAHVAASVLRQPDDVSICVVATDLTELESSTELIRELRAREESLKAAQRELTSALARVKAQNEELTDSRQKLEDARAYYRHLVEGCGSVVILADRNLNITFMNQYGREFFGFAEEEIIGHNAVGTIIPREDDEGRDLAAMAEDLRQHPGNYVNNIHENRRRDGSLVWMSWANRAILNRDGEMVEVLAVGNDLTRLREAEEALRRSNRDLEAFAYAASHDLQEPLRVISLYLDLLQRSCKERLDEAANGYVRIAREGCERMSRMIRDLLDYSRVDRAGRNVEPVETAKVLRAALEALRAAIEETGAVVTSGELPPVNGEPVHIQQLLQNLVGNAIKFRKKGTPPRVHISAAPQGNGWRFSVRDNGIGIPPDKREAVFQLFHRLHSQEEYPGTGVGLALCKKIVERHGGRLWVDSQEGEGSTFFFELPG